MVGVENLLRIRKQIEATALRAGRDPSSVTLVAVSKGQPVEKLREAIEAGHSVFGENYAQELKAKACAFASTLQWHFIGHLQRNKVKDVIPIVQWIHTIDSLDLARAISARATHTIKCCIEVNVGDEASKHGVSPENVAALAEAIQGLSNIELRGLMCIPPFSDDPESSRPYFRKLAALRNETDIKDLSMGMTNDFQVAIEEGATIVRIGTGIFGARK